MATTTVAPGEGLTIRAAAAALGMSPSTVRRHIKEGRLHAARRPTTQGHEWRVFLGDHLPTRERQVVTDGEKLPTAGDQVATTNDVAGNYLLTRGEQVATTGGHLPTNPAPPGREGCGAGAEGSTADAGAAEPIEARYRVTPAEIEQAIERTSARYVADVHTLFDRVSAEVGRLYDLDGAGAARFRRAFPAPAGALPPAAVGGVGSPGAPGEYTWPAVLARLPGLRARARPPRVGAAADLPRGRRALLPAARPPGPDGGRPDRLPAAGRRRAGRRLRARGARRPPCMLSLWFTATWAR